MGRGPGRKPAKVCRINIRCLPAELEQFHALGGSKAFRDYLKRETAASRSDASRRENSEPSPARPTPSESSRTQLDN